jgi:hypothetical protein
MMVMSSMRKCVGQIAAALVVGAACAGAAGQCVVRFGPADPALFSNGLSNFVVADFDRDGWPDVAATLPASGVERGSVYITRNARSASDVSFNLVETRLVGSNPGAIAAGDLDGDGLADVVAANRGTSDVSVLFGNGDGTFQTEVPRRVGLQPSAVAIADFNMDGRDDIVSADWLEQSVSVILTQAGRQFAGRTTHGVGWLPISVSAGEVNGDGHLDLLTVNDGSNDFSVLLGDGQGGFAPERFFRFGQLFGDAILSDLNNDGRSEVVALYTDAETNSRRLGVISVTSNGLFQIISSLNLTTVIYGPMVTADFDGDGDQDINVDGRLFVNIGNSTLQLLPPPTFGGNGSRLQSADVNADGRSDFVSLGAFLNAFPNASFPVTQQPQSTVACPIGPTTFSAAANGTPPYTYRWQYRAVDAIPFDPASWVDLVPGTNAVAGPSGPLEFNAAGTDTGTLTVDREALLGWPASSLIGSFRCIIGSACGDVITQEAVMTTSDRCSCYDFNSDENVDLLDAQQMAQVFVGLITPQADWLSGDLNADENADLSDAQALAVFVVTGTCGV